MASIMGSSVLGGILGGMGGAMTGLGKSWGEQQKLDQEERLARDKMAQEQQYRDALVTLERDKLNQAATPIETVFKYIGMPVPEGLDPNARVPTALASDLIKNAQEQQKAQREQGLNTRTAAFLQGAKGQPGQPAQLLGQLAEGEDPEAAALIPRSANVPAVPGLSKWDAATGLAALGHKDPAITSFLNMLYPADNFAPLPADSPGYINKATGEITPTPFQNAGMPQAPPGPNINRTVMTDWRGRQSTTDKPIEATNMRDALAQTAKFGGLQRYEDASPEVKSAIIAEEQRLMESRGAAGAGIRQGIEMNAPIGKEAENFTDPKTLMPARAGMPKQYVYDNFIPVPQKAVQSYKTLGQTLAEAERVIRTRDDLFPPASKNYAGDIFSVGGAMAKYWATKRTDPDVRIIEGLQATIPLQVRTFGDVGNIAVAEREIATSASGLGGPSTKEAALANVALIRRLVNESGSAASLPPLESLPRGNVGGGGAPPSSDFRINPDAKMAPKLPPGGLWRNGQVISESGKYIWDGSRWQPR